LVKLRSPQFDPISGYHHRYDIAVIAETEAEEAVTTAEGYLRLLTNDIAVWLRWRGTGTGDSMALSARYCD